ncbi:MAG: DUF3169 family protein [Coprococcus sp.]
MKDTDKKVNKKSNLKIYIIFAVMILASLLGGFLAGRLAAVNKDTLDGINWDHIWWITADTLPIVYGVLMLATFVVSFIMYGKIKRMIRGWDGENEDVIVDIESRITTASYLPCVIVFVGLVLFPVCIYAVDRSYSNSKGMPMTIVSEVVFVVSMILYCVIEKLVIDEEKKLNPEKKGNIFDINFRRDWEKSSDEAELIAIAKSSKKGFMAGIKAGFVMWILTFMSMFAFDTGVMPIVAVGLVLIVMYVAYCREFVRLQK